MKEKLESRLSEETKVPLTKLHNSLNEKVNKALLYLHIWARICDLWIDFYQNNWKLNLKLLIYTQDIPFEGEERNEAGDTLLSSPKSQFQT